MTNKGESEDETGCDARLAAFLAIHLVRQVLDEAYIIANSAIESGQPWRYHSMVKGEELSESEDGDGSSKTENNYDGTENNLEAEAVANVVATSTPHKAESFKHKPETTLIGQGDEDIELQQAELAKSTSMFINHLFDMSEVETVIVCEDSDTVQINSTPDKLITQAMTKLMDSDLNHAFGITFEQPPLLVDAIPPTERSSSTEFSEYSFLSDAYYDYTLRDVAFYIHEAADVIGNTNNESELSHIVPNVQITEINDETEENVKECMERNDVARLESAYLSLNRDYEQCSDDERNVILDDPKGMTLQEIELLTADSSDENEAAHGEPETEAKCEKSKELTATSAVSAVSKKSIVSRCRSQGARLLACLRGWWRRRTPGKRKEHQQRAQGSIRGMCPLSPDARRRTASLIDHRELRSPSPSRPVVWKFNTVNETVVNSTRWKDYTFNANPDECGEY